MQLEAYLQADDRIVLPVGSTEQHAYLSLETDNILAERASVEAAEPLEFPCSPCCPTA
jgi:creatinine amidohydrolase